MRVCEKCSYFCLVYILLVKKADASYPSNALQCTPVRSNKLALFLFGSERYVELEKRNGSDSVSLEWDKDDAAALRFVCAAANVRAHVFGISQKSPFDVKSMAGNIIPAVATVNGVVAGLSTIEGIKILAHGSSDRCNATYLDRQPNQLKRLLKVN